MRSTRGAAAPEPASKTITKRETTPDLTVFGTSVAKPKSPVKVAMKKRDVKAQIKLTAVEKKLEKRTASPKKASSKPETKPASTRKSLSKASVQKETPVKTRSVSKSPVKSAQKVKA